jgi:hypothetical protein
MNLRAIAREPASAKRFGASRYWNVTAGAVAFIGTCLVLHVVLPAPVVSEVGLKMRFFAAHKDDFDTIFLGSSRIHSGVAPAVFDGVLAENGVASRTFNFGASGMYPPENFFVLEQILALKPRNLKRVFLEIDDVQATWLSDNEISQRPVYCHDAKSTWLIIRKVLDLDVGEPLSRKLRMLRSARHTIARHLSFLAMNISNRGRASDLVETSVGGNDIPWEKLGPKLDGYFPAEEIVSGEGKRAYKKELAREQAANATNVALDRYADQSYRHYARQIRKFGATPVFLVSPIFPQFPSRFSGSPPGLMLVYNRPSLYPDFYRDTVRVDAHHLNSAGATEFTRLVALDFLKNTSQP